MCSPHGDKCAPAYGTNERYVMMHKLNWLASELHKSYGPLFSPTLGEEAREAQKKVRSCIQTNYHSLIAAEGGLLALAMELASYGDKTRALLSSFCCCFLSFHSFT